METTKLFMIIKSWTVALQDQNTASVTILKKWGEWSIYFGPKLNTFIMIFKHQQILWFSSERELNFSSLEWKSFLVVYDIGSSGSKSVQPPRLRHKRRMALFSSSLGSFMLGEAVVMPKGHTSNSVERSMCQGTEPSPNSQVGKSS